VSGPRPVQTHSSSLLLHPPSSMSLLCRARSAPAWAGPFPQIRIRKARLCALGVLSKGSEQLPSQLLPICLFQLWSERKASTPLHFRKPHVGGGGREVPRGWAEACLSPPGFYLSVVPHQVCELSRAVPALRSPRHPCALRRQPSCRAVGVWASEPAPCLWA